MATVSHSTISQDRSQRSHVDKKQQELKVLRPKLRQTQMAALKLSVVIQEPLIPSLKMTRPPQPGPILPPQENFKWKRAQKTRMRFKRKQPNAQRPLTV
jgi:hypothetical protein